MTQPDRSEGFSAVELMITLAVAGIMFSMSLPPLARYMRDQQVIGTSEEIAGNFRLCRQRATAEGEAVVATWNTEAGSLTAFVDINDDGAQDSGESTVFTQELPGQVHLANAAEGGFGDDVLTFLPDGSCSEGGRLEISGLHGLSRRIQVIRVTSMVKVLRGPDESQ